MRNEELRNSFYTITNMRMAPDLFEYTRCLWFRVITGLLDLPQVGTDLEIKMTTAPRAELKRSL